MSPFAPTYHHNLISQLVHALAGLPKEGWIARGEVPVRCRALYPSQSKDLAPDVAVLKLSDYRQRLPIFTSHMVVMAVEVLSPGNSRASMLEKTQFIWPKVCARSGLLTGTQSKSPSTQRRARDS